MLKCSREIEGCFKMRVMHEAGMRMDQIEMTGHGASCYHVLIHSPVTLSSASSTENNSVSHLQQCLHTVLF